MINIAIDGPSAAGKSTIANECAAILGYVHLDTGAMYRCVAYLSKQLGIDESDEMGLAKMIDEMKISFKQDQIFIDGEEVTSLLRNDEMSMRASNVSKLKLVREKLVALQQKIAQDKGYILDGRDIGTVVLQDAELKIFLVASCEARAQRRIKEYQQKGIACNPEDVLADIIKRDYQDSHRANSPLTKAEDAIEIDTSNMSIEDVLQTIRALLKEMGVMND